MVFFGESMSKQKTIYMMVGIPGSGKSTWIRDHVKQDWAVLSPDTILERRYNYEWTPERAAEAWAESYRLFGSLLLQGRTMVWDATFISPIIRAAILHTSKGAGYRIEAVFCDTPVDVCVIRNASRDREPVPESTIHRMADNLVPPTEAEGFDRIQHLVFE